MELYYVIANYFWLIRLDSNQERQNQNLLCYHYTTDQNAGLSRLPEAFT